MAKKSQTNRDLKRAKLIARYRKRRAALRKRLNTADVSVEEKLEIQREFSKLPRNSCLTRQTRRCAITGRSHAVYRKAGLSRILLRSMALRGELPGIQKSSW